MLSSLARLNLFSNLSVESKGSEDKNLSIASNILNDSYQSVTVSNDIISRVELPIMFGDEIHLYIKRFGEERMNEALKEVKVAGAVRSFAMGLIQKLQITDSMERNLTMFLAITLCGVGECQDTSFLSVFKLLEAGCKNIHLIEIKGKDRPSEIPGDYFDHEFVVIGDVSPLKKDNSITNLDNLDDKCIVLDRYLNLVGKANQYRKLAKDYIDVYQMNQITKIIDIPEFSKEKLVLIKQNATDIAEKIKDFFQIITHQPIPIIKKFNKAPDQTATMKESTSRAKI